MANKKQTCSKKKKSTGKAKQKISAEPAPPVQRNSMSKPLAAVILVALSVFIIIGYFNNDGEFILFLCNFLKGLIGYGFYLTAPFFLIAAVVAVIDKGKSSKLRLWCSILLPLISSSVLNLFLYAPPTEKADFSVLVETLFEQGQLIKSGGILGGLIAIGLEKAFSIYGAGIILIGLLVFCVFKVFNIRLKRSEKENDEIPVIPVQTKDSDMFLKKPSSPVQQKPNRPNTANRAGIKDIPLGEEDEPLFANYRLEEKRTVQHNEIRTRAKPVVEPSVVPVEAREEDEPEANVPVLIKEKKSKKSVPVKKASVEIIERLDNDEDYPDLSKKSKTSSSSDAEYMLPPLSLLRTGTVCQDDAEDIVSNRRLLEDALQSFGINSKIVNTIHGPTVTRYDIKLEQGVKLSRVTNLSGDLALALGVINVRIAPIPNQISTVGIEVPNKIVSTVFLGDVVSSDKFASSQSKLSIALGKDISGTCIVGNISKLPHLLVAGTTGSGKSVCINSIILSILYKATPEEVRFIMIDPKMVELGVYNDIPHMYVPVVTEPKKASGALQWAVREMLDRYQKFSEYAVRDLEHYNGILKSNGQEIIPQIVVIIDELADLMMAASKEVEESICRIAQMGRAAGIHLIVATQRPSSDVITGLMKANIPSRIAFAVSSGLESRIILDQTGAEKLIGMGDMLYSPVGVGKPVRIQGAYVSDEEREEVIQFIKEHTGSSYEDNSATEAIALAMQQSFDKESSSASSQDNSSDKSSEYDEMLSQAVEVVLEMKQCSVSMLQRRLKLGYSRAARVVDQMEELGVVGQYEGSKPRQVVISRDEWLELKQSLGIAGEDEYAAARDMNDM